MRGSIEIKSCEVCGSRDLKSVLNLGSHPLCDDLVPVGDNRICQEYPIELLYCQTCFTVHQRFQVSKLELFPNSYHYRSRFTGDVLSGMGALVESCKARLGELTGKVVLDIGCNDGSLLDFFRREGCETIGMEPTDAWIDASKKGHCLYHDFFSPASADILFRNHGSPDVITFTNVFAHIENLPEVLQALGKLIAAKTLLVIENHYLGSVLDGFQFDTFYHEHPRTYSVTSFLYIARSLGVSINEVEFPSRYGGNVRVFMSGGVSRVDNDRLFADISKRESQYLKAFEKLQMFMRKWQVSTKDRIRLLGSMYGALSAKAFPGRAAILIKMLGINERSVCAVFEKPGSMKIGYYVPGTRIPIKSDEELFFAAQKPQVLLNMAWHISEEIRSYLKLHGFEGEVIDILDPRDFSRNN